jgi:hypothetical protein
MKKYPGIRYGFRPTSYWDDLDPLSVILRNVTGETRRQIITDYWKAGRLEELASASSNKAIWKSSTTPAGWLSATIT